MHIGGGGESALSKPYCFLHRQFLPTQIYARGKSLKAQKNVVHHIAKLKIEGANTIKEVYPHEQLLITT